MSTEQAQTGLHVYIESKAVGYFSAIYFRLVLTFVKTYIFHHNLLIGTMLSDFI